MQCTRLTTPDSDSPDSFQKPKLWKRLQTTWRTALAISSACLLTLTPNTGLGAHTASLNLANQPLFITSAVEPNIMHLLDDSGSMEWEFMVSDTNGGVNGVYQDNGMRWYYTLPTTNNGIDSNGWAPPWYPYTVPPESEVPGAWRARNSSFNTAYYNPAITYSPWAGTDGVGNPLYTNATPTAAPVDPNNTGTTFDLTVNVTYRPYACNGGCSWRTVTEFPAHYYTWTDTDADGLVDASDGNTRVDITNPNAPFPKSAGRTDCSGPNCSYTEEIQNFANWFTYFRKRNYIAKSAIGNVINNTSFSRMGMQIYNGGLIRNASTMSVGANKVTLWQDLYNLNIRCDSSCPGTPQRRALRDLGNLYEGGSSPILPAASGGTCQQNFSVVVGDGFWNGGSPGVGNTDQDGAGPWDGDPYADTFSDTLADVAMHYYERDLKTGLLDEVPVVAGVDVATHQHMVTYSVAFGIAGGLDPFDTMTPGDATDTDPTDPSFNWTDPTDAFDADRVDDMWHAAYNGRGLFLSASNPQELSDSLTGALADISNRTGSAAAVAVNTRTLSTNTRIYQARFVSGEWSGELRSLPLDPTTGTVLPEEWNTRTALNGQNWNTGRRILTHNSTTGTAFRWSNLSTAQQNLLDLHPVTAVDDNRGDERLDYLRGDATNEPASAGATPSPTDFRYRGFKLGDIVNSAPVFVGVPPFIRESLETDSHNTYANAHASRRAMIYVGANDGMVHGFDATTGEERLAYVPSVLYKDLPQLTNTSYTHQYFVDASPTSFDAHFQAPWESVPAWHSLLVGGVGGGGQAIYALDISDPDGDLDTSRAYSESAINAARIVSWEFTDAQDADLGYTYGKPTIAKMANGKWAAIFGNGYNNREADGNVSTTGNAALFIVFLEAAANGNFTAGTDYIKLDTKAGSITAPNGLAAPAAVDDDDDGVIDYVYAGDLEGNMWKFDVTATNEGTWKVAHKQGSTPKPLFIAVDSLGNTQPITGRPEVGGHPAGENGLMVYFGTGKYIENGDNVVTGAGTQTFYAIWDKDTNSGNTPVARSDLLQQTLTLDSVGSVPVRTVSDTAIDWDTGTGPGTHLGWYVDLPTTGERVIGSPMLIPGETAKILFITLIPETGSCTGGGSSWLMELDVVNGGAVPDPIFDINGDGVYDASDQTSGGANPAGVQSGSLLSDPVIVSNQQGSKLHKISSSSSGGVIVTDNDDDSKPDGRQGWRQLR